MRRRPFLCALPLSAWLPLFPSHAQEAEALPAQVRRRLDDNPLQRGGFEQRKTLKGFKHPLVSRGDYLVVRERGVVWRTHEPFVSMLVLTRDKLVSRGADGAGSATLDSRSGPGLPLVNQVLFALMAADVAVLARYFKLTGRISTEGPWQLVMLPGDAGLASWLKRIELEGDRQVLRVQWHEASGDQTEIHFQPRRGPDALTAEEAARFD